MDANKNSKIYQFNTANETDKDREREIQQRRIKE